MSLLLAEVPLIGESYTSCSLVFIVVVKVCTYPLPFRDSLTALYPNLSMHRCDYQKTLARRCLV